VASFVILVRLHLPPNSEECPVLIYYKVYDHSLTLGVEIQLVWPTPWSIGKILYFATSYLGFLDGALLVYGMSVLSYL